MKTLFLIGIVVFSHFAMPAQSDTRPGEADAVKKAVGIIAAAEKPNVEIVTRDLRELEGRIIGVYEDTFVVDPKQPKKRGITIISIGTVPNNRKPSVTIKYRDVLQIEGKRAVISVVPDPKLTPFSAWDNIPSVGVGAMLQVLRKDGRKTHGVFTTWSDNGIRLMQGNDQAEIPRHEIVRIYQLAGDLDGLAAKLFGGGRRGAEVAEDILPIMDATARAHPPPPLTFSPPNPGGGGGLPSQLLLCFAYNISGQPPQRRYPGYRSGLPHRPGARHGKA